MWQDLRYSVRTLAKHPAFVLVAVVVLALGIGINVALFSIVNAVFFRPLPVHAPEELVYLYTILPRQPDRPSAFIDPGFHEYLLEHREALTELTGHWGTSMMLTAGDATESARGESVLANYFDVLGVKPMLGRGFLPQDDLLSTTERSVVISHRLWTRRFNSDPNIVGNEIRMGLWGVVPAMCRVVGVMGPEFTGIHDPWTPSDFWMPSTQASGRDVRRSVFAVIGRLAPGVSTQQAKAIVAQQGEQWWRDRGAGSDEQFKQRLVAYPATEIRMPYEPTAAVVPVRLAAALTVVVSVVLLIAAVNIAGLLVARGVGRTGEVAVRLVVGASAWRIARQLLVESVWLAALGGIGGFVLARWLLGLFVAYTPNQFAIDVPLDLRVVAFAIAICLAVGVGIGLAPALRATKIDLTAALPGSGTGVTKRLRSRFRYWVVIPQVSLALVLLLVAAVHVRSLMNLELTNPGYATGGAVVLSITMASTPAEGTADRRLVAEKEAERTRVFYRQLLGRIQEVTGTAGAAMTQRIPGRAAATDAYMAIAQEDFLAGSASGIGASRTGVSPGYFGTVGMTILSGRDFDDRDSRTSPPVAIVSAAIAQQLWPGRSPIGRFVAARNNFPARNEKIEWMEVVGVVNEVDPILRDVGQNPFIYIALGQQWRMDARTLVARVPADPQPIVARLKNAVMGADPLAEVYRVQTMEQVVGEILYPRRMASGILAIAGAIGWLLASIGLYGVVSYSVAHRVHEIGVRAALGASRSDLLRMIVREGMQLVAIGVAVGFVLNYATARLTAKMFAAVPALDGATIVGIPLFLATVIVLACYLPARRAAAVDPMTVLRRL